MRLCSCLLVSVRLLFFVILCASSINANAEGFDMFGEHQKLVNQTIVESGDITEFSRRSQETVVYQIGQSCFVSSENLSRKAGLLLVNQYSNVSIVTFSPEISSIKTAIYSVTLLGCVQVIKQFRENIQRDFENRQLDRNRLQRQMEIDANALKERLKKQQ